MQNVLDVGYKPHVIVAKKAAEYLKKDACILDAAAGTGLVAHQVNIQDLAVCKFVNCQIVPTTFM